MTGILDAGKQERGTCEGTKWESRLNQRHVPGGGQPLLCKGTEREKAMNFLSQGGGDGWGEEGRKGGMHGNG